MREILKLDESHICSYSDIALNAYPSFKDLSEEGIRKYKDIVRQTMRTDKDVTFYGMFEKNKLIAVMRLFNFSMNLFGKMIQSSGIGFLGVHLMHKKEKCAKEMIEFYEDVYRKQGVPIALLLPFRPDFYKKMGYGIGTKMNQYRLPTTEIPPYYGDSDIRYIDDYTIENLLECHNRVVSKTHGMIMKIKDEIRHLQSDPYNKIIGNYDNDGNLSGYMIFQFENAKEDNYTINNIIIKELVYENVLSLKKLLGFLRKQEDQVRLVIFNTEDENFHYLFDNPLNDSLNYIPYGNLETNTQAVGVMYKILDIRKAFEQSSHRNYNHSNLNIRFLIYDEMKKKAEEIVVGFNNGKVDLNDTRYDATVKINLANFSSLFLGSTSVTGLYNLGALELDDSDLLEEIDRTFYYPQKPVCNTDF